MNKLKITRKKFLKLSAAAISIPFLIIWEKLVVRFEKQNSINNKVVLPKDIPSGITFFNTVIVSRNNSELNVYSSKCTHLGCRINKTEDGVLICPCHGSRFDKNGNVINGPASRPLRKLNYNIDSNTKKIVVSDV